MNTKLTTTALVAMIFMGTICSTAFAAKKETAKNDTIVAQIDPLIIDITDFEGRQIAGDRAHITIVNGELSARIPTVIGMAAIGAVTSSNALMFERAKITPSNFHYGKKGKSYSFTVHPSGAIFFNRQSNSTCRISITVNKNGYTNVSVESEEIGRFSPRTRTWHFGGEVNKNRTEAATLLLKSAQEKASQAQQQ